MKIGSKLQFTVPDKSPLDCPFIDDIRNFGQNAMCGNCPVFVCSQSTDENGEPFCLVDPRDFRDDWAEEWERFFKDGTVPKLYLKLTEDDSDSA